MATANEDADQTLPLAVQSNGNLVIATRDRHIEVRRGENVDRRVATAGRFGSAVTGLAVLSDDAVVVGTADGEIQVLSHDLEKVLAGGGGMAGPGDGISRLVVDRQDRIVIQTRRDNVRVLTRDLQEFRGLQRLVTP